MKKHPNLIALSLALAAAILPLTASARLAAWYPLDETPASADTVTEAVSGTTDGTFTIGTDPDPAFNLIARGHPSAHGGLGTSYLLTKGAGLDLGGAAAVQPTDKFTISFWFQPLTFDPFDRFLESQVGNDNGQDGLRIDTGGGAGNHVRVLVRDANGAVNQNFQHPTVLKNDGTWYFFAFRYDSDGFDNDPFQLTVLEKTDDPVDDFTIFDATNGPAGSNVGPMHFPHAAPGTLIGVSNPEGTGGNNLNAAIDELAFWDNADANGVLSDEQLADAYNFGPSGVQIITGFATDLNSVSPGNPATLTWDVNAPFDTLTLDDGNGNVTDLAPLTTAGAGSIAVTPNQPTTYLLRATRSAAANASAIRILAGAAPVIDSFTSDIAVINEGTAVNLTWLTTGADSLTLDPGATDVSSINTTSVSPTETTTYTLSATNPFGTTTADVVIQVITGPVPAHRYFASTPPNNDTSWLDEISTSNWTLSGTLREDPLFTPSANTNITASYSTGGGTTGGSTTTFQFPDFTAELWIRPLGLTPDHEVIFETGGGQNGLGILINDTNFRFIGSAGDARTLDLTIPVAGLNLEDFLQVVVSTNGPSDDFSVSVRDTFGNVRTATEVANLTLGGNGAGLFTWASGGVGGNENNLGGRTEEIDASPEGLTGFAGEIAIVNIYDHFLDETEIQAAFDAVATTVDPPVVTSTLAISSVTRDAITNDLIVTWNSTSGKSYDAQFSTDLVNWFELDGPFVATADETTQTLNLPLNQPRFHVRIRELAP